MLALFLGACGWQMWSIHKYNAAVREAEEAGFFWQSAGTFSLIRKDWHNALKKETWGVSHRYLDMGEVPDLGRYREVLYRIRPTILIVRGCENVDILKGLTSLERLWLDRCPSVQNVDELKDFTVLQWLSLSGSPALKDVSDGLKGLTGLQSLNFYGCPVLENLDGLKHLHTLQKLNLRECPALKNIDALKGLTGLQQLDLRGCKIPAAALRELRAALPNTDITFPDGTKNPPQ